VKPLIVLPQVNEVTFYTRTPKDYDSRHRKNANCLLQQQQKHYIDGYFFLIFKQPFFSNSLLVIANIELISSDHTFRNDSQTGSKQRR
jgi:hypothetical protein